VNTAAAKMVERARTGGGPSFLVCNTYRYTGHHVGDISREYYRSKQEETLWKTDKDPLKLFSAWLKKESIADAASLEAIDKEVAEQMKAAVEFAIASPYPASSRAQEDVYA
jgi:TPP-dependent pyruvate/acetoin dehydrogenase alpha subunit